jgi:hypothetical protein
MFLMDNNSVADLAQKHADGRATTAWFDKR